MGLCSKRSNVSPPFSNCEIMPEILYRVLTFPVQERYLAYWKKLSRPPPKMLKELATHLTGREVEGTETVQPGKGRLRDGIAICNCLMGRDAEKMATPSNRHKLYQGTIKH